MTVQLPSEIEAFLKTSNSGEPDYRFRVSAGAIRTLEIG